MDTALQPCIDWEDLMAAYCALEFPPRRTYVRTPSGTPVLACYEGLEQRCDACGKWRLAPPVLMDAPPADCGQIVNDVERCEVTACRAKRRAALKEKVATVVARRRLDALKKK